MFMEQQQQAWLRQQALHANVDSSDDDDLALMESKDGEDGFRPRRDEKEGRRRARKTAGALMIDVTDIRKPAQKRDGDTIIGDEQPAKKSQDISTEAAVEGLQPSLPSGSNP